MSTEEPDYHYPWSVEILYRDGSRGEYEFRDKEIMLSFITEGVQWDAVSFYRATFVPPVLDRQYKLDVKYQS
jgi:hypothetical protein